MRECVEEGILQAYFDGELSSEMMQRVATHIAACARCGEAAREVEAESAMFAEAFAPEMALSVPTERLRSRIDAAIADLQPQPPSKAVAEPKGSRLRSWLSGLMAPLTFVPQQQAIGFASLLAVAALGLIFAYIVLRPRPSVLNLASGVKTTDLRSFEPERNTGGDAAGRQETPAPMKVSRASMTRGGGGRNIRRSDGAGANRTGSPLTTQPPRVTPELTASNVQLLPGEKSYLKAIASLDTAIKASGDNGLRPTLRAEYERNLQVVDEAIAQTRVVARHNPNDKDAAEFLFSAYQSKVDLMNTVAEQAQLSTVYR